MDNIELKDICFDKEDIVLFSYDDDLLLKGKAIQNSILPKLDALLRKSINYIESIYGIALYDEFSHHVYSPHFTIRENPIKTNYKLALSGISGNRLPIWKKLSRDDKKPVKIIPVHLQYEISQEGLLLCFYIDNRIDLGLKAFRLLFSTLYNNIEEIQTITSAYDFKIETGYMEDKLIPIKKRLKNILNSDDKTDYFFYCTKLYKIPFNAKKNISILEDFAVLFPMYYDLLLIAQGKESQFKAILKKFKDHYFDTIKNNNEQTTENSSKARKINSKQVKTLANKSIDSIGIRAGIRWQVFERDNFTCVACGASRKDGAILHVDHIIPRSKGGKDSMDNYQTLCQKCNIGKSNKSRLNLRTINFT